MDGWMDGWLNGCVSLWIGTQNFVVSVCSSVWGVTEVEMIAAVRRSLASFIHEMSLMINEEQFCGSSAPRMLERPNRQVTTFVCARDQSPQLE